ncbi:MAG: hypothetical protein H7Z42_18570 [Roseiflexaceae bacterium]|nr:hypothetical protein [Roseiflexaceae bacterium]
MKKILGSMTAAAVVASTLTFANVSPANAAAPNFTYSTGFQIQNLSQATATVSLAFYAQGSGTPSATVPDTIPAGSSKNYSTLPSAVAAGFSGGAVISSDQKVAATVNIIVNNNVNFGDAYTGISEGSTKATLPLLFKDAFGFNTFFNVQNTDATAAAVTVTFSNGTTQTATVQPNSTARFDQASNAGIAANFIGSAVVTADKNIAVTAVQVDNDTLASYNGFSDTGNLAPIFPLVNSNNFGYVTGIPVTNVGTAATNVVVTYTPSSGIAGNATAPCTETQSVAANETKYFALTSIGPSANTPGMTTTCTKGARFVGSGKVTTNSGNQPLVALVSQLNQPAKKSGIYGAANATTATSTVLFPIINDRFFGYNTGFSITNVGNNNVNVSCSYAGQTYKDEVSALAPGGVFTTLQTGKLADRTNTSGTCVATAVGGSDAKIVGVINQLNNPAATDALFVSSGINN